MRATFKRDDFPNELLSWWPNLVRMPGSSCTTAGWVFSWWRIAAIVGCHRTEAGQARTREMVRQELERRRFAKPTPAAGEEGAGR